jgi:hypothetical protein
MSEVKYKFYATLLDAYQRYLDSESEEACQELIDKINRVPFESEAAEKGTAFNELIDKIIKGGDVKLDFYMRNNIDTISVNHTSRTGKLYQFEFKMDIVREFADYFQGATSQVFAEAEIETSAGNVLLYGWIDEMLQGSIYDIKTKGQYTFPSFLKHWQHIVYPYCLNKRGNNVSHFQYTITEFSNTYTEDYYYNPEVDEPRLKAICEELIHFIETKRGFITDKKIFALE